MVAKYRWKVKESAPVGKGQKYGASFSISPTTSDRLLAPQEGDVGTWRSLFPEIVYFIPGRKLRLKEVFLAVGIAWSGSYNPDGILI